jgi:hypothetical protein
MDGAKCPLEWVAQGLTERLRLNNCANAQFNTVAFQSNKYAHPPVLSTIYGVSSQPSERSTDVVADSDDSTLTSFLPWIDTKAVADASPQRLLCF